MAKFKVGDKVRCRNFSPFVGTVTQVFKPGELGRPFRQGPQYYGVTPKRGVQQVLAEEDLVAENALKSKDSVVNAALRHARNKYPMAAATNEEVKMAVCSRDEQVRVNAIAEAKRRGMVINRQAEGDEGKCTTCAFGNYEKPRMSCRRGYDPSVANGECRHWKGDSMTDAVSKIGKPAVGNMGTQDAITAIEMLLGSGRQDDKDEALEILARHRSDIESRVGRWQYQELYRRASNATA